MNISKISSFTDGKMQILVPIEADSSPDDNQRLDSRQVFLLYKQMLRDGVWWSRLDHFAYPVLFKVCADLSLSRLGHMILGHVLKVRLELVSHVLNASIHMFASCGEMENARKVFDESPVRDLVSWNSLINGYKKVGEVEKAIRVYKLMVSGYARCGLRLFQVILDVVCSMFIGVGCRMHGNVAMGEKAAKKLIELDPGDSGIYVLLEGVYEEANMWEDAKRAKRMMNNRGVLRRPLQAYQIHTHRRERKTASF